MKFLFAGLLVVFVLLQVALWSGGLLELWELRRLNTTSEIENNELEERNRALERKVAGMKSGPGAIEETAREELGMIKQGETFFRVIERAPRNAEAQ